jgi:hypothetical protein
MSKKCLLLFVHACFSFTLLNWVAWVDALLGHVWRAFDSLLIGLWSPWQWLIDCDAIILDTALCFVWIVRTIISVYPVLSSGIWLSLNWQYISLFFLATDENNLSGYSIALVFRCLWVRSSSFPFPFVPLQRRGCLVAPWFLWIVLVPCVGD